MDNSYLNSEITWMKGLALHCPMGDDDIDCPFFKMRSLPIRERIKLIDEMSVSEIGKLASYHDACLRQKEAERFSLN